MDEFYAGRVKTIWLLPGAETSWNDAEANVPPNKASCKTQFRARLKHLADFGTLHNRDLMNWEGDGCFVVKATCGLRAWGWLQHYNGRAAVMISHVVLKKSQNSKPADLKRTVDARKPFKEQKT